MTGLARNSDSRWLGVSVNLIEPRRRFRTLKHWCAEYRAKGYRDAVAGLPPDPFGKFHEGRDMLWHQAVRDAYDAGHRYGKKMTS